MLDSNSERFLSPSSLVKTCFVIVAVKNYLTFSRIKIICQLVFSWKLVFAIGEWNLFDIVGSENYLAGPRIEIFCIGLPPQTLFDMEQDEKKNIMPEFDAEDEKAIR